MDTPSESERKSLQALREWGLDMARFQAKAKASLEHARADWEVRRVLQQALAETTQILAGLQKSGEPAAAELKIAFERAWHDIERGFSRARARSREARHPRPDDSYWLG